MPREIPLQRSAQGSIRSCIRSRPSRSRTVLDGVAMLATELLKTPDPKSPLKGEFGMKKRVAWSDPVALDDSRPIGAPHGAKINDVLVAAMAGALRAYLQGRHVDVNRTTVRAMVPVDLRPPGAGRGTRQRVRPRDPGTARAQPDRIAAPAHDQGAHGRAEALARGAVAILPLFNLFGRVPKAVEDFAVDLFGSKASLVMTNVAGPQKTIYVAGVPIDRMMFWVPHPGRQLGMGISILSYKGPRVAGRDCRCGPRAGSRDDYRAIQSRVRADAGGGASPRRERPATCHGAARTTAHDVTRPAQDAAGQAGG